ncbi:hypothetical protein [Tunturiibacter gelidiferens]|uniref:hypothetical protein n=1 Tax=Tunturiibacter gelidiferens TaxID=3069689 RepID=UPI003D9B8D25
MHRTATTAILALAAIAATLSASAAKLNGSAALKDLQPFGTTDKEHKHQAYDLSFDAEGHSYTCRTDPKNPSTPPSSSSAARSTTRSRRTRQRSKPRKTKSSSARSSA